jgi:NhaP-type Na+/H+ or K+/H+ antiporter
MQGGYSVKRALFFRNLPAILGLAFAGGIFSTVVVAVVMYFGTSGSEVPLSLVQSLIFGALISSTDPVTILAMLPEETDKRLYMLIFGESALNDAVAIILYRFFSELADPSKVLTADQFFLSLAGSAWVFIGSFGTGVATAFIFAKLTKHQRLTHEAEVYEVIMMLVFAYSSYLLGEALHLSGIVSVFFTGVAMARYARPNMTSESLLVAKHMMRVFSTICDCFIFMYLGMGLLAFPKAHYDPSTIIVALFAIALGRGHVFIVCGVQNMFSKSSKIPFLHQVFVWFSGLRGAVAFALSVQLLENTALPDPVRRIIFGTSVIVIVITVYGLNLITPLAIDRLGIAAPNVKVSSQGNLQSSEEEDEGNPNAAYAQPGQKGLLAWLYRMDKQYLMPFLTNNHDTDGDREHIKEYAKVSDGINLFDLTGGDVVPLTTVKPTGRDGQNLPERSSDVRSDPSYYSS